MFEASVRASFSGAHRLKGYRGKCEKIHGHNWDVEVVIGTDRLDPEGLSVDFRILKRKLRRVISKLDHEDLNKIAFFKKNNSSAENISKYIYINLKRTVESKTIKLKRVRVWETRESAATYFE